MVSNTGLTVVCRMTSRKHFRVKKRCWLPAFSPCPFMFQKSSTSQLLKLWWCAEGVNLLQNNKILDLTKLKAIADNQLKVGKMTIPLFDRVESTVGKKGENAGYQHFLLLSQCFQKPSSLKVVKSQECVVKS